MAFKKTMDKKETKEFIKSVKRTSREARAIEYIGKVGPHRLPDEIVYTWIERLWRRLVSFYKERKRGQNVW